MEERIQHAAEKQEASEKIRKANGKREIVQQQIVKLADKRDELIQIIRTYLQQSMASLDEFNEEGQELIPKVAGPEIGRASCRERGWGRVGSGRWKWRDMTTLK